MAQTAKGFPYPVGTDRVMDGDNAIQALAEAVDTKLGVAASGTFPAGSLATGTASIAVTFPAGRFTVAPAVMANCVHPDSTVGILASSATGATLGVNQRTAAGAVVTTGNSRTGYWLAVQVV